MTIIYEHNPIICSKTEALQSQNVVYKDSNRNIPMLIVTRDTLVGFLGSVATSLLAATALLIAAVVANSQLCCSLPVGSSCAATT